MQPTVARPAVTTADAGCIRLGRGFDHCSLALQEAVPERDLRISMSWAFA